MKKLIVVLLVLLGLTWNCDVDQGLEPTQSGIEGMVYFENEWPDATDEVVVVAATVFPPTAIEDIVMSEPLPLFTDSARYVIYANPQTFAAVGVVWKEKDQPWDVTNIISIFYNNEPGFTPASVTIPDRGTMVTDIDMQADLELARRNVESGIDGMLRVSGDWPETAEQVLVAASKTLIPQTLLDITFGAPIKAGFDSTEYSLMLQPGTYYLVGALVVDDQPIGLESLRGLYYKNPGDFLPGSIVIPTDTTRHQNIDIELDFDAQLLP